jgi:membrane dipeptidase
MEQVDRIGFFDGHNDTLKNLYLSGRDFFKWNEMGHIDIPRARKAGMQGGLFAILCIAQHPEQRQFGYGLTIDENSWEVAYPERLDYDYAIEFTMEILNFTLNMVNSCEHIKIIYDYQDILESINQDKLAIVLHFEGAEAIKNDLCNLEFYYEKGLRSLGPVWSRPNAFGYGVPFKFPCSPDTGPGLTQMGKNLIHECNKLGIIIDLAHINKKGFFDVAQITHKPLVVSHAGVHNVCPSTTNLCDSQIDAIGDTNGIIGIIFDILNTRPDGRFITDSPLEIIVRHIDYITNRIGIDHVGIGSDFDGGQMPASLKDVSYLPQLLQALKIKGYSKDDIEKIAYKNWYRILEETWKQ